MANTLHRGVGAEWGYFIIEAPNRTPAHNFYHETDEWVFQLMQDAIAALPPEPVVDFAYDAPKKKVLHGYQASGKIYPAG